MTGNAAQLRVAISDDTVSLATGPGKHTHTMDHTQAVAFAHALLTDVEAAGRAGRTDVNMKIASQTITIRTHDAITLAETILDEARGVHA